MVLTVELNVNPSNVEFCQLSIDARDRIIAMGLFHLGAGEEYVRRGDNNAMDAQLQTMRDENQTIVERYERRLREAGDEVADIKSTLARSTGARDDLVRGAIQATTARYETIVDGMRGERDDLVRDAIRTTTARYETTVVGITGDCERMRATVERSDDKHRTNVSELCTRHDCLMREADVRRSVVETELQTVRDKYEHHLLQSSIRGQNSSFKGQDGEDFVFRNLTQMFPSGEVEDTHTTPGRGDFIVRDEGICMMIETKNYSRNVTKSEIDKFYRDVEDPANSDIQCAILVSMTSGICNRVDFEFEVRGGRPLLFLHNIETNAHNMKIASRFFKMILAQKSFDFSDGELLAKLKTIATSTKREFTKQKKVLDKYYSSQLKSFEDVETSTKSLFELLAIGY